MTKKTGLAMALLATLTLTASCGDNGKGGADGTAPDVQATGDAKDGDASSADVPRTDALTDTSTDVPRDMSPTDTSSDQTADGTPPTFRVGGTITGLTGSGLVLQDNGGDNLTIAANATTFTFVGRVAQGGAYAVTVLTQPSAPAQTCTVSGGSGQVSGADVTNVEITCTARTYTIGGTISGLTGGGLVLRNNGGDNLTVSANATTFTFATAVSSGDAYAVTVLIQPSAPTQLCTVAGGAGNVGSANVTTVAITCVTQAFTVGGTISGLVGGGLTLRNNGGDSLILAPTSTTFSFLTPVASNAAFAVTVFAQPTAPAQTCTVSGGTGVIGTANVTSVVINCSAASFTVGGTVNGLRGTLVLHNGTENQTVTTNGGFAFPTPVATGATYAVTVMTPPASPHQTCTVANGTGTVASANVTSVMVTCTLDAFHVRATVTGLAGTGLVLRNGLDLVPVATNSTITFPTAVDSGGSYSVSVMTQPSSPNQTCSVAADGSGAIAGGDVTATVTCVTNTYRVRTTVTGLTGTGLVLHNGADSVPVAGDTTFTFPTRVASGSTYLVTVTTQPSGQLCTVSPSVATLVVNADVTATVTCVLNTFFVRAAVGGLAMGDTVVLHNGGDNLTVTANGTFPFATKVASGATYTVTASPPTGPIAQTCVVTPLTATIMNADATVTVTCTTSTFVVNGSVVGLATGDTVVLHNGGDNLTFTANGSMPFATRVASGAAYTVTASPPTGPIVQTCVVAPLTGTIMNVDVTVTVTCTTSTFVVTGAVAGLATGDTVVLHNGADNLTFTTNVSMPFATRVASGAAFTVTASPPTGPIAQTCTVSPLTGTITNAAVTVTVTCTTNTYFVNAAVSGLAASTSVTLNDGTDNLIVSTNTTVPFPTKIASGGSYTVTVVTSPVGQLCSVTAGGGTHTIAAADVTVTIVCVSVVPHTVGGAATGLIGTGLTLRNNGADDTLVDPAVPMFTFPTPVPNGGPYLVTISAQPTIPAAPSPLTQACFVGSGGSGTIMGANVTNVAVDCHVCTTRGEGDDLLVRCPTGQTISNVVFASFGTPSGSCGSLMKDVPPVQVPPLPPPEDTTICDAPTSLDVVKTACIGLETCTIPVSTALFSPTDAGTVDPCVGVFKHLTVEVTCQ